MKESHIKLLGVKIADINIPMFVELVLNDKITNNSCISATGAHGLIESKKNRSFNKILNSFSFNLPDGKPLVWLAKIKGAKNIRRCFGPNLFEEVIKKSANTDINHFFCGGKKGVAEKLRDVCEKKYNNHHIVGVNCPPFRKMNTRDFEELSVEVNSKNVDILWIGISTSKQEQLAFNLSKYTNVKMLITVGAAFDYHTGSIKYAPKWIQESGFEWLFRLISEPKRLWKR